MQKMVAFDMFYGVDFAEKIVSRPQSFGTLRGKRYFCSKIIKIR